MWWRGCCTGPTVQSSHLVSPDCLGITPVFSTSRGTSWPTSVSSLSSPWTWSVTPRWGVSKCWYKRNFAAHQNVGVLWRIMIGLYPPIVARLISYLLYFCFYLFLATNVSITVFRITLVTRVTQTSPTDELVKLWLQPDKFWNADHEGLYRRTLLLLIFLSVATVATVELIMSTWYRGMTSPCTLQHSSLLSHSEKVLSHLEFYLMGSNPEAKISLIPPLVLWIMLGQARLWWWYQSLIIYFAWIPIKGHLMSALSFGFHIHNCFKNISQKIYEKVPEFFSEQQFQSSSEEYCDIQNPDLLPIPSIPPIFFLTIGIFPPLRA